MELTAILCNHAEAVNNLLFVSGGAINRIEIPQNVPPPWGVTIAIGIIVDVPWQSTNQEHQLEIVIVDSDGNPVVRPDAPDPVVVQMGFEVGRPPGMLAGEGQQLAAAANFTGLLLSKLGGYEFRISIDGDLQKTLAFRVVAGQNVTIQ